MYQITNLGFEHIVVGSLGFAPQVVHPISDLDYARLSVEEKSQINQQAAAGAFSIVHVAENELVFAPSPLSAGLGPIVATENPQG